MSVMRNPVLAALAQARMRAAPMFARWCELNGVSPCPAAPAAVAGFVADCASLGIERLWPSVQEISTMHASMGLADPTLGGAAAAAISGKEVLIMWAGIKAFCLNSLTIAWGYFLAFAGAVMQAIDSIAEPGNA